MLIEIISVVVLGRCKALSAEIARCPSISLTEWMIYECRGTATAMPPRTDYFADRQMSGRTLNLKAVIFTIVSLDLRVFTCSNKSDPAFESGKQLLRFGYAKANYASLPIFI